MGAAGRARGPGINYSDIRFQNPDARARGLQSDDHNLTATVRQPQYDIGNLESET